MGRAGGSDEAVGQKGLRGQTGTGRELRWRQPMLPLGAARDPDMLKSGARLPPPPIEPDQRLMPLPLRQRNPKVTAQAPAALTRPADTLTGWYGPARDRWKQVASGPEGTETVAVNVTLLFTTAGLLDDESEGIVAVPGLTICVRMLLLLPL